MANTLAGIDQGMVDDESKNTAPNVPSALPVLKWGAANGYAPASAPTTPTKPAANPGDNTWFRLGPIRVTKGFPQGTAPAPGSAMALADAGVPHPDLSNVTGSVVTPSTQTAQREAATLQRASLSLPSLPSITPTAAAPGTGVVGGWGGDGFSALDFGNGSPNANTLNPAQVAAAAPQAKAYLWRARRSIRPP